MRPYAGVGSRETPLAVCALMTAIGRTAARRGFWLRSGGAERADEAFQIGAGSTCEIYRAADCTPAALEHASRFHPAWHKCGPMARRLHGRNSMIVLGRDLCSPVEWVWCWTKDGGPTGGTGQAIRIANAYGIPVLNLHDPTEFRRALEWAP